MRLPGTQGLMQRMPVFLLLKPDFSFRMDGAVRRMTVFTLLKPGFSSRMYGAMQRMPIFIYTRLRSKTRFLVCKGIPSETGFCCVWLNY